MKMIKKAFKTVDMFRIPVQLYYKRDYFTSAVGGVSTVIILVLVGIIVFPVVSDFFSFQNYSYITI